MPATAISHERLMKESEQRLFDMARGAPSGEQFLVSRILENPAAWVRWETEHSALLRPVARQRRPAEQSAALKTACFSLIHRKALFEHLREQQINGAARQKLLQFFHRTRGYTQALIAEHEVYLRASCSYLCTSHLGSALIRDGVFQEPMRTYEELYAEYFRLFCEGTLNGDATRSAKSLLPYLKFQIAQQRDAILAMPRRTPSLLHDIAIRQATGDTERLRVDALRADFGSADPAAATGTGDRRDSPHARYDDAPRSPFLTPTATTRQWDLWD